jgi:hypothetical protein
MQVVRGGDSEKHRDSEEETRRRRSCEEETGRHTETPRRRLGDAGLVRRRLGSGTEYLGGDSEIQRLRISGERPDYRPRQPY